MEKREVRMGEEERERRRKNSQHSP